MRGYVGLKTLEGPNNERSLFENMPLCKLNNWRLVPWEVLLQLLTIKQFVELTFFQIESFPRQKNC